MRRILWIAFYLFVFLAAFGIVAFFNQSEQSLNIEEQLANLTDDYAGILDEVDTEYGKLTFFALENGDDSGVGLALFAEGEDGWVREESTYHMNSEGTYSSDGFDLQNGNKVVYAYGNHEPIEGVSEVPADRILDAAVGEVHYMIVPQGEEVNIDMPDDEQA
ncbi:hypothetical protein [Jeotgalibacillus haloalkalitolerans]|uniref:DUF4860 domain-containing protein n=1 Tax=Jeotgalibacillus haloalkalitolerans TaxID=3104292 RepID=A0ABU5KMZ8_9BACL|nr:hypothetical protein [Jeotgalibacillus sp. HH7-29]MDZ5712638.1 hypothetical protein [Jeotgalibacillus sp. HH7-29]